MELNQKIKREHGAHAATAKYQMIFLPITTITSSALLYLGEKIHASNRKKQSFSIKLTSSSLGLHVLKTVNNDDSEDMSYQEFEDLMYFHSVATDEEKQRCK